jgi:hypothetical protein
MAPRRKNTKGKRINALKCWAAITPDGNIHQGWGGLHDKDHARTSAAMAYNGSLSPYTSGTYASMPGDWHKAQRAGWRIAPVVIKTRRAK